MSAVPQVAVKKKNQSHKGRPQIKGAIRAVPPPPPLADGEAVDIASHTAFALQYLTPIPFPEGATYDELFSLMRRHPPSYIQQNCIDDPPFKGRVRDLLKRAAQTYLEKYKEPNYPLATLPALIATTLSPANFHNQLPPSVLTTGDFDTALASLSWQPSWILEGICARDLDPGWNSAQNGEYMQKKRREEVNFRLDHENLRLPEDAAVVAKRAKVSKAKIARTSNGNKAVKKGVATAQQEKNFKAKAEADAEHNAKKKGVKRAGNPAGLPTRTSENARRSIQSKERKMNKAKTEVNSDPNARPMKGTIAAGLMELLDFRPESAEQKFRARPRLAFKRRITTDTEDEEEEPVVASKKVKVETDDEDV